MENKTLFDPFPGESSRAGAGYGLEMPATVLVLGDGTAGLVAANLLAKEAAHRKVALQSKLIGQSPAGMLAGKKVNVVANASLATVTDRARTPRRTWPAGPAN